MIRRHELTWSERGAHRCIKSPRTYIFYDGGLFPCLQELRWADTRDSRIRSGYTSTALITSMILEVEPTYIVCRLGRGSSRALLPVFQCGVQLRISHGLQITWSSPSVHLAT